MKLTCKTRGNTPPQGKPQVYFTTHADDYDRFFEDFATQILGFQNCAVYYDTEPAAPCHEEELAALLQEMKLFVIPVTRKFLLCPNRARETELGFAQSHHIPVLPVTDDSSLIPVFNRICGEMQVLCRFEKDPTALPYEKKLRDYLESVLIGDEDAQKVRTCFDAHIFLSYRKKDRKYAQSLMRLIHSIPAYQNIAIWYDEFLVPGENYNDAIGAALSDCDLFAMAVTPNLLEAGNYVMETEYPEAVQKKKTILPAELVPTPKSELNDAFNKLPPCVDGTNPLRITAALRGVFPERSDASETNPERDYYIGLAYLSGIDIEVDHEKALRLITVAAEANFPEAQWRLVQMYRSGLGVEMDLRKALQWQKSYTALMKKRFEACGDRWNYYQALYDLSDQYLQLRELEEAKEAAEDLVDISTGDIWKSAEAHCRLGEILKKQGKTREALSHFAFFSGFLSQWRENGREISDDQWRVFFDTQTEYAFNLLEEGTKREAQKVCEETLEAALPLIGGNASNDAARLACLKCYGVLSDIFRSEANTVKARHYLDKAEALSDEMLQENPSSWWNSYNAVVTLTKSAALYKQDMDYEACLSREQKALKIMRQIHKQLGESLPVREQLASCCQDVGEAYTLTGDYEAAYSHLQEALELYRRLSDETGSYDTQLGLARTFNSLAVLFSVQKRYPEAKDHCLKAMELVKNRKDFPARRLYYTWCIRLGTILGKMGDLSGAGAYLREAIDAEKSLGQTVETLIIVSEAAYELGRTCMEAENYPEARRCYELAVETWEKQIKAFHTVEDWERFHEAHNALRFLRRQENDFTDLWNYLEDNILSDQGLANNARLFAELLNISKEAYLAADWLHQLLHKRPDSESFYTKYAAFHPTLDADSLHSRLLALISAYMRFGLFAKGFKDYPAAKVFYENARDFCNGLLEKGSDEEAVRHLIRCLIELSDICILDGQKYSDAHEYFAQALPLAQGLGECNAKLVDIYRGLGDCSNHTNGAEASLGFYQKALSTAESAYRKENTEKNASKLALTYWNLADLYNSSGNSAAALESYFQAYRLYRQLAENGADDKFLEFYLRVGINIAHIYSQTGEDVAALRYSEETLQTAQGLVPENASDEIHLPLYFVLYNIATRHENLGNYEAAYQYALKAAAKGEKLPEESRTEEVLRSLSTAYRMLCDHYMEAGDIPGAQRCCEKEQAVCQERLQRYPSRQGQEALALSCRRCGEVLKTAGNNAGAKKSYEMELQLWTELAGSSNASDDWVKAFVAYYDLNELNYKDDVYDGTGIDCEKSLALLPGADRIAEELSVIKTTLYCNLGHFCLTENNSSEAEKYLTLIENGGNKYSIENLRSLALLRCRLADAYTRNNKRPEANMHYITAIRVCDALVNNTHSVYDQRLLQTVKEKLASPAKPAAQTGEKKSLGSILSKFFRQ